MSLPLALCALGSLWCLGLWHVSRDTWRPSGGAGVGGLRAVVLLALALRGLAFALPAYLEVDFYRYFWDAKQVLSGFSPYAHPLSDALGALPADLVALQSREASLIAQIRQDTLLFSTLYAPLAVGVFAGLDLLPGSPPLAFVVSFLLAEAVTLLLLRRHNRDSSVFWFRLGALAFNPLLVLVTYNGLHFDIWLLPLLVSWVLALRAGAPTRALLLLGLAIALRHWAVVLLPLTLMALPTWRARAVGGVAMGCALLIVFLPQGLHLLSDHSGLRVYGRQWEMNDALFVLLNAALGQSLARAVALGVPLILALILPFTKLRDPALAGLILVGALLLLSPTFFPWYWLWLLPFALLWSHPLRWPALALGASLPLYYARFWFDDRGQSALFDQVVVWIEFGPILALIVLILYQFSLKQTLYELV